MSCAGADLQRPVSREPLLEGTAEFSHLFFIRPDGCMVKNCCHS